MVLDFCKHAHITMLQFINFLNIFICLPLSLRGAWCTVHQCFYYLFVIIFYIRQAWT